jgi:hypothetical protein
VDGLDGGGRPRNPRGLAYQGVGGRRTPPRFGGRTRLSCISIAAAAMLTGAVGRPAGLTDGMYDDGKCKMMKGPTLALSSTTCSARQPVEPGRARAYTLVHNLQYQRSTRAPMEIGTRSFQNANKSFRV